MKRRQGFAALALLALTACGGADDPPPGASASGLTVRLIQSGVGNPIAFGTVAVDVWTSSLEVELNRTGGCCVVSGGGDTQRLISGVTDQQGRVVGTIDPSALPDESTLSTITYTGVDATSAGVNDAINAFFAAVGTPQTGYFLSGDGPGYAPRTIRVDRARLIGTQTITLGLDPL